MLHLVAPEVLNYLPLQHPRGRPLQLQDFDESYVERLRAGDFRTQEHFVAYFSELIQLKLRSRLHSPQAIEDVRQETFTRVFAALRGGTIRQPERLGAFVNSMCNNVLLEHYRASSRDSSLEDEEQQDFPAVSVDVLGAIAAKQMAEKIREILEEMPERDRRLLREVFLEERDKDDVCRDFGVDRDYLRVLLHRAKQSFKSMYMKNMAARPPGAVAVGKR
jgi:RNA polymerase sigma-70 factor (ECF subfamily)